jgi:hypothetical protein
MQVWSSNDTELIAARLNVDYAYPRYFVESLFRFSSREFSRGSRGDCSHDPRGWLFDGTEANVMKDP